jgi:hypothetical protein
MTTLATRLYWDCHIPAQTAAWGALLSLAGPADSVIE